MLLGNIIKRRVVTMVGMGMLCVVAKRVRSVWWQQQAVDFDAFVRTCASESIHAIWESMPNHAI
jgi:hypothetical protein